VNIEDEVVTTTVGALRRLYQACTDRQSAIVGQAMADRDVTEANEAYKKASASASKSVDEALEALDVILKGSNWHERYVLGRNIGPSEPLPGEGPK